MQESVSLRFYVRKKGMNRDCSMGICMGNLPPKAERGKNAGTNSGTRFPQASYFKKTRNVRNMGVHVQRGIRSMRGIKTG